MYSCLFVQVFNGSRHEIFHDKDQEIARQVVLDWLNAHCTATATVVSKL